MDLPTRVLFVDDDENVCRSFARAVGASGLEVTVATTHSEARAAAKSGSFGVVVVDLYMPEGSGFDLCEELRALLPAATIAITSGELSLDLACDAVNDHGISYMIRKPWQVDELVSLLNRGVEEAWERHASRRIFDKLRAQPGATGAGANGVVAATDPRYASAKALLHALAARDPAKKASGYRIAAYARRLAEEMGVEETRVVEIEVAALVHDVGMLAIPEQVLNKQGALTADEWRVVKSHPDLGARLLDDLGEMTAVRNIVLQHHERWQGDGYPSHLRGTEICLGARIVAVVDTFDALTAGRPHRDGVGHDMARAEIFRCQGTHFDSEVVAAFLAIPASALRGAAERALATLPADERAA